METPRMALSHRERDLFMDSTGRDQTANPLPASGRKLRLVIAVGLRYGTVQRGSRGRVVNDIDVWVLAEFRDHRFLIFPLRVWRSRPWRRQTPLECALPVPPNPSEVHR